MHSSLASELGNNHPSFNAVTKGHARSQPTKAGHPRAEAGRVQRTTQRCLHHALLSSCTTSSSSAGAGATMPSIRGPIPLVCACTTRPSAMRATTGLGRVTATPREPKWSIPSSTTAAVKRPLRQYGGGCGRLMWRMRGEDLCHAQTASPSAYQPYAARLQHQANQAPRGGGQQSQNAATHGSYQLNQLNTHAAATRGRGTPPRGCASSKPSSTADRAADSASQKTHLLGGVG